MPDNTISLDELKSNETPKEQNTTKKAPVKNKIQEVSIEEIAPYAEPENTGKGYHDELLGKLDMAIQTAKVDIYKNLITSAMEQQAEIDLDSDEDDTNVSVLPVIRNDEDDDDENTPRRTTTPEYDYSNDNNLNYGDIFNNKNIDKDEDDDDEETDKQETLDDETKEQLAEIRKDIKNNISPIRNIIDLSTFKISNKAVSVSKLIATNNNKVHVSDWVLPSGKKTISMSAFGGSDIDKIDISGSRNIVNAYTERFNAIYEHLVDPNKAPTMEAWTKTINMADVDHLTFAVYKASFETSNYVPYLCPECKKTFMKKVDIKDMVKFKNDKSREIVTNLFNKNTATAGNVYDSSLIQVSDQYAISLKLPSVYTTIFENSILDETYLNKFRTNITVLSYIDNIFSIDTEKGILIPVDTRPDPMNLSKTVKRRIRYLSEVLKMLTSDQYSIIIAAISELNSNNNSDLMSYIFPETECKFCNHKIEETEQDPISMLFTRHRLIVIANSSEEQNL